LDQEIKNQNLTERRIQNVLPGLKNQFPSMLCNNDVDDNNEGRRQLKDDGEGEGGEFQPRKVLNSYPSQFLFS
jgi:hypothetical protein